MSSPGVFLSHSHHDNAACQTIASYLQSNLPDLSIFFDQSELHGGDEWFSRIQRAVYQAPIFIVALSRQSIAAEWVTQETFLALNLAVEDRKRGRTRIIIPARIDPELEVEEIRAWAPLLALRQIVDVPATAPEAALAELVAIAKGERSGVATPRPDDFAALRLQSQARELEEARDYARQTHEAVEQEQWRSAARLGAFALTLPGAERDATLLGDLARALVKIDQIPEALPHLDAALKLNSRRSDLWRLKASVQAERQEYDAARQSWNMAFVATTSADGRLEILREQYAALLAGGQTGALDEIVTEALSLVPGDAWWRAQRSVVAEQAFLAPLLAQVRRGGREYTGKTLLDGGQPRALIIPPLCRIPAGPFWMGTQGDTHREPWSEVTLDAFDIAMYPLTLAEYRCAVRAGAVPEPYWAKSLRKDDQQDHPVDGVSWRHGVDYAAWLSRLTGERWRLPTEAEWEKAARGIDGRIYPWGNTFDAARANIAAYGASAATSAVGSFASAGDASPYGCHDMAGNVWEWTSSIYSEAPYAADALHENSLDHRSERVLRGGMATSRADEARVAHRTWGDVETPYEMFRGFRLVRALR